MSNLIVLGPLGLHKPSLSILSSVRVFNHLMWMFSPSRRLCPLTQRELNITSSQSTYEPCLQSRLMWWQFLFLIQYSNMYCLYSSVVLNLWLSNTSSLDCSWIVWCNCFEVGEFPLLGREIMQWTLQCLWQTWWKECGCILQQAET